MEITLNVLIQAKPLYIRCVLNIVIVTVEVVGVVIDLIIIWTNLTLKLLIINFVFSIGDTVSCPYLHEIRSTKNTQRKIVFFISFLLALWSIKGSFICSGLYATQRGNKNTVSVSVNHKKRQVILRVLILIFNFYNSLSVLSQ